jgi:hypothetical protein
MRTGYIKLPRWHLFSENICPRSTPWIGQSGILQRKSFFRSAFSIYASSHTFLLGLQLNVPIRIALHRSLIVHNKLHFAPLTGMLSVEVTA